MDFARVFTSPSSSPCQNQTDWFLFEKFFIFSLLCTRIQKYLLTFRLLKHCIKYIFHLTLSLFLLNYYGLLWYYYYPMYYAVISFIALLPLEWCRFEWLWVILSNQIDYSLVLLEFLGFLGNKGCLDKLFGSLNSAQYLDIKSLNYLWYVKSFVWTKDIYLVSMISTWFCWC